jgi:hypothetical protein
MEDGQALVCFLDPTVVSNELLKRQMARETASPPICRAGAEAGVNIARGSESTRGAQLVIRRSIVLNERHQNFKLDRLAHRLKLLEVNVQIRVFNQQCVSGNR